VELPALATSRRANRRGKRIDPEPALRPERAGSDGRPGAPAWPRQHAYVCFTVALRPSPPRVAPYLLGGAGTVLGVLWPEMREMRGSGSGPHAAQLQALIVRLPVLTLHFGRQAKLKCFGDIDVLVMVLKTGCGVGTVVGSRTSAVLIVRQDTVFLQARFAGAAPGTVVVVVA